MQKIRVGVFRGGKGSEFEVSLKTGGEVLKHLPAEYERVDLLVTRDGIFHIEGAPISLEQIADRIDVAFIALHGEYGEDGQIQRLLNQYKIPFTGSDAMSSAHAMHKGHAHEGVRRCGLRTPFYKIVSRDEYDPAYTALELFQRFPQPSIIKPIADGSSAGVYAVQTYEEIKNALNDLFSKTDAIIVEEFITGREATCGVIEGFRGDDLYTLPPTEIILPASKKFFDFESKYDGSAKEIFPGNFNKEEKKALMQAARLAHQALGLRQYSRSDFIVSPRGIYFLETNSLPGLTEHSLLPKALEGIGSSLSEFLDHTIRDALGR